MDEIIFQEFKGTGNMEVVLDRRLADRRVWPAIDIQQSGTRKEERILDPETLARVTLLRRTLADMKPAEGDGSPGPPALQIPHQCRLPRPHRDLSEGELTGEDRPAGLTPAT